MYQDNRVKSDYPMDNWQLAKTFTNSILNSVEKYEIDGIELKWRSKPNEETVLQIVRNIRNGLNQLAESKKRSESYLLALAVPFMLFERRDVLKLDNLLNTVDFITFVSPLKRPFVSIDSSHSIMKSYEQLDKLNMGLEFYGTFWTNSSYTEDIWWEPSNIVPWREIGNLNDSNHETSWDERSKSPYILNSETLEITSFENEKSLVEKMKYVKENSFGGVAMTRLNYDDDQNTLLNAVTFVDLCSCERNMESSVG
ncbi:unnamed protein product [Caenorhabditis nigoni]